MNTIEFLERTDTSPARWRVTAAPHILQRVKRIFPKVDATEHDHIHLVDNLENCRDLWWFCDRYDIDLADHDLLRLQGKAERHVELGRDIQKILSGDYTPVDAKREMTVPPREYQVTAAELCATTGRLLLADEVGAGKTISSITMLAKTNALPCLLVVPTHMPSQWKGQLDRCLPGLRIKILKSGQPKPNWSKGGIPDVIISNYHKLHGWAQTLTPHIKSIIFDEIQELRHHGSDKYKAAQHLAHNSTAQYKMGLSIGPESLIELVGGPFGLGWSGPIEVAWTIMSIVADWEDAGDGHYIIRPKNDIRTRGWEGDSFIWKRVTSFICHNCTKTVREVKFSGRNLLLTDDHSAYIPSESGVRCVEAQELTKNSLLLQDGGWDSSLPEAVVDVVELCKHITKLQVTVDLSGVTRQQIGVPSWAWQNFKKEATFGDRVPVGVYLAYRHLLPATGTVYVGGGKAASLPTHLKLSSWAYVLGFFLGDGWATHQRVSFAVEDARVANFCKELINLGIGLRPEVKKMKGRSYEVRCSHKLFATIVKHFVGAKCWEKSIPSEWVLGWGRSARQELLRGLVDSDGHEAVRKGACAYSTVSKKLAFGVSLLLRSLGFRSGINTRKPEIGGLIGARVIIGRRDSYTVSWSSGAIVDRKRRVATKFQWTRGRAVEVRVRDCQPTTAPPFVYDLSVEGHPSFVAEGVLVHNSATPIHNYGGEMFNVLNILEEGCLGDRFEFYREYCVSMNGKQLIKDPSAFGTFLRDTGLMLRRTRADIKRELDSLQNITIDVEVDMDCIKAVEDISVKLARILTNPSQWRGDKMQAGGELSHKLREATGLAKAVFVAEFVNTLVESGEKVLLYGWHRKVYAVWEEELWRHKPEFYTGTESTTQKEQALEKFLDPEGECKVLIMSLRSGAGVDGLQAVCSTVVFGEIDWSPAVHHQASGRIHREGQASPVVAYYPLADVGSDPVVSDTLGVKKAQLVGIVDPYAPVVEHTDPNHMRKLALSILKQRGEKIDPFLEMEILSDG